MILFYVIISIVFFFSSLMLFFKPGLMKKLYLLLVNKSLVMVYGVLEIIMALGILHFKSDAKYGFIPLIIGILLFLDGILYVVFSSKKETLLKTVLNIQYKTLKKMSLVSLIAALALLIAGISA